ncbi:uncharacterized protein K452DRAFT_299556 [Aplosporella prunicola CBS 121167]|uniref:Sulfite oxidase n=1 Tax=Aplosporella prunicola CBS 121167 TaxID=1176127 RepID=A0A6A6B9X4_9PEZI|nr:uncharacterized protein K452DRAFT_299556 [Aplosporella prunicola CBS 121167]KAF2140163.1 hypothetical protein K452DRAFT_299556 [Aplosporella prunicola CBS 121167]
MVKFEYSAEEPLNREPPLEKLISSFLTKDDGYDRNHGAIPHIDPTKHRVRIDGAVKNELSLTLLDLQSLPQHSVVCALQCAGNRRHTMRTTLKEVQGIDWADGAVMNCSWRGPLLRDVLAQAGIALPSAAQASAHVAFACHSNPCQEASWYGSSIPLARALDPAADVLLALDMNAAPLTPNHGCPVRAIAPGIAGARCVKWLDRVTVQPQESSNFYQQRDYKILPPEADSTEAAARFWDKVPALQDMPVNSVIGVPGAGSRVSRDALGTVLVRGYALPAGMGGPVVKVEVSADGKEWVEARLLDGKGEKWAWCLWEARLAVAAGKGKRILSRATDRAGNVQQPLAQWNLRGVAYNGYGEVADLEVV